MNSLCKHTVLLILSFGTFASTAFISKFSWKIHHRINDSDKRSNSNKAHNDDSCNDNAQKYTSTRETFITQVKTASIIASASILSSNSVSAASETNPFQSLQKTSTSTDDVLSALDTSNHFASYVNGGTAIVTGGNSGIGFETVASLAKAGMNVILCSRRYDAGLEAVNTLPTELKNKVVIQKLDLSDMNSIQSATNEILSLSKNGIDLIVNNAGVIDKKGEPIPTSQGLELQFGINHVGHQMFTRLLLPSINKSGRVVTVASEAHRFAKTDVALAGKGGYSGSKYCNIVFAQGLQDRLNAIGRNDVKSVSLHPGVIATPLFNKSSGLWNFVPFVADRNKNQGAATTILCSLVDNETVSGGSYYKDCHVISPSVETEIAIDRLWDETESIIASNGFKMPGQLI